MQEQGIKHPIESQLRSRLHLSRLPDQLLKVLTRLDVRLLELLLSLCQSTARTSPGGAVYAYAGEAWLAKQLGSCQSYVSERIQVLEAFGLIQVTHRRKRHGRWLTNLYRIGHVLWRILKDPHGAVKYAISALSHHIGFSRNRSGAENRRDHAEPGQSGAPPPAPLPSGGVEPLRSPDDWKSVLERIMKKVGGGY